jgi:alpha-glutamyl/putrescinyl thymine pyrophosphorylase clade 1
MYYRRLAGSPPPWTADQILRAHRFTNVYRVTDRVSQYLVREVQYREHRSQAADEVFFRTILFKLFNKIETWEALETELGPIGWQSVDFERLDRVLHKFIDKGQRIYSAAYIMPSPAFGEKRKHSNHLRLLKRMMEDKLPAQICVAPSLQSVYHLLISFSGIGKFLALQFAIDLNYSSMIDFDEGGFVVAGPGALDGISKCFPGAAQADAEQVIMMVTERQVEEFASRGIGFPGLFGRPLQPIDCQNLFCEISKYSRAAHPEVKGVANRQRIKQVYRRTTGQIDTPFFPPKWRLEVTRIPSMPPDPRIEAGKRQASLF